MKNILEGNKLQYFTQKVRKDSKTEMCLKGVKLVVQTSGRVTSHL